VDQWHKDFGNKWDSGKTEGDQEDDEEEEQAELGSERGGGGEPGHVDLGNASVQRFLAPRIPPPAAGTVISSKFKSFCKQPLVKSSKVA